MPTICSYFNFKINDFLDKCSPLQYLNVAKYKNNNPVDLKFCNQRKIKATRKFFFSHFKVTAFKDERSRDLICILGANQINIVSV